jgi:hypothetical protein
MNLEVIREGRRGAYARRRMVEFALSCRRIRDVEISGLERVLEWPRGAQRVSAAWMVARNSGAV